MNELEKIQKAFLWNDSTPKITHETLCNDYKTGGLKNVGNPNKTAASHFSWIPKLYDDSFRK